MTVCLWDGGLIFEFLQDSWYNITMKANIHPQWYPEAKISCVCGAAFSAGSVVPEIRVDICSKCHPFFLGDTSGTKLIDTQKRIARYEEKKQKASEQQKRKKEPERAKPRVYRTLREMIEEQKRAKTASSSSQG